MAVGKPDFNLNSYGIKYFQKGEDDDLSDTDFSGNEDKVSTVNQHGVIESPKTPKDLATAKLNTSLNRPSATTGLKGLSASRRAANANKPATVRDKPAPKPKEVKPKHTKDTKYVFNAEQNPKELSVSQAKLLQDVNEARPKNPKPDPITGITPEKRRETSTTGVIANSANVRSGGEGGKTEDITEVPDPRKRGGHTKELMNVGRTRPKGYKEPKGEKAERKRLSDEKKEKETKEKEVKEKETRETKDIPKKMGSRMVGNAPPEVKNTTEQTHSGKKVTVGVGSKAKEVFDKREGVGAVHEETSKPKTVVVTPDKELNTIGSTENKRLRDHNTEMDKFLKGATPAQRREYTAIKNREDGREDYDAQRKYARNITGKESKTQEKVTQTKEEKEKERKQDHADRMVDMKERANRIESDAEKENEKVVGTDNDNKQFHGTEGKAGEVSTIASKPKDKKPVPKDNPNASKAPEEESEPDKITTDDIDDKLNAIASKLAQIKDPKERAKKRLELSGQNEADKSKKEIEVARRKVEAAKKKVEAGKKKKETAKKKKVVPKEGQLTPAQIKAYRAERQAKKDTVAKSNDIITTMNILKLDLMNKKDGWDKEEKVNNKKRVNHKDTWSVKPRELTQESPEVVDPDISMRVAEDEHFAGKDRKTGKITDEKKLIPAIRVGDHPSSKEGFIPSGLGMKHRDTKYTVSGVTGNKKLPDKDRAYNTTPAMMTESYESAKLHKAADETIFKAISLKLDLMNKKSRFKPSNPLHRNIHPNNMGKQDDPYYKNVDLSWDFDKDSDKDAAEYQKKLESDMEKKIRAKIEDETRYDHYGKDL